MGSVTTVRKASSRLFKPCDLKRLQHLRLMLSTMCASLFQAEAEKTIGAPILETLLINCTAQNVWGHQARLCNSFEEVPYCCTFYVGQEAASVLAISMKAFMLHCPKITHMSLIDCGPSDNEDQSVYATFQSTQYHARQDLLYALQIYKSFPI